MNYPEHIFISGTDTDVGKTVIAAIMVAGLRSSYWKPIQSGLEEKTDTEFVRELTGLGTQFFHDETYRLARPLSPHASSELEGVTIDLDAFELPPKGENSRLIVEGAGGIMVPLNRRDYMLDLMKKLNIAVLLVARSGLGTINHTLLSLDMLRKNNLEVLGVVMNGPKNESNKKALEYYGGVRVIAEIDTIPDLHSANLKKIFEEQFA